MPLVLSLCDFTGNMVRPWANAGFHCICVDLQHQFPETKDAKNNLITYVCADVRNYVPPSENISIVFAFPPCTHLAVSGARWFASKGVEKRTEALNIVNACRRICELSEAPWMIENPVSILSTYWRKPNYIFDPYEYAGYSSSKEAYTKKTCLWTSDSFIMPPKNKIAPFFGSKLHYISKSSKRGNLRSKTPRGFAKAVFEANVKLVS